MQHGHIDIAGRIISGWAIDLEQIDQRCILDVYIDKKLCLTVGVGDLRREDAADTIGSKNNTCGFNLDISFLLTSAQSEVEIRYNSGGNLVPGENPFVARASVSKLNIFEGCEGYLFYSGDRNNVIDQMLGNLQPDEEGVRSWADRLCLFNAATKRSGGKFIFTVVPDKIAVVPKLLSETAALSEERTVSRLMHRASILYDIEILYPLNELRQVQDPRIWLSRNDSHLNMRAQHYIFKQICARAGLESGAEPVWVPRQIVHDLASYNETNKAETSDIPTFASDKTGDIRSVQARGANAMVYINPNGQIPLIFAGGHSSCRMVSTFLKEIAQVTVVFFNDDISVDLIEKYKPRLAALYISERNIYGSAGGASSMRNLILEILIDRALELTQKIRASHRLTESLPEIPTTELAPDAFAITESVALEV